MDDAMDIVSNAEFKSLNTNVYTVPDDLFKSVEGYVSIINIICQNCEKYNFFDSKRIGIKHIKCVHCNHLNYLQCSKKTEKLHSLKNEQNYKNISKGILNGYISSDSDSDDNV